MKQCFGYVRVSTVKQGEGVSLEAQKDAISAYAQSHDIIICRWFEEKVTAAKKGRPVFNAVVRELMHHKADGLVVHKIDRSARNFADWARIGDLSDAGIDVHFASETLDFRSRGGRLSADIQAVIAADYIRNLRDECQKGIKGRLKQGLCPWGAPVGYLNNGKGKAKTPDPARAPLIKRLFELYASRTHSIRSLQIEMAKQGLRNTGGRPLSKHGIETILANPFYCGILRVKSTGDTYVGCHEPLITLSLFETVQSVKAGKVGKKVTKHNHTYRGLFRCRHCQFAMIPELQKGHVYYRCQSPACPTTTVREEQIEGAVLQELKRVRFSKSQIARINREAATWAETPRTEKRTKAKQLQLAQLDQRLERLTDALIDRLIDADTFTSRKETLVFEGQRIREELSELQQSQSNPSDLHQFLELIKNLAQSYVSADRTEKRQIVELTTSNRFVSGKSICLEPQNWLQSALALVPAPCCEPNRPTSRITHEMSNAHVTELIEASRSENALKLKALFEPTDDHDAPIEMATQFPETSPAARNSGIGEAKVDESGSSHCSLAD